MPGREPIHGPDEAYDGPTLAFYAAKAPIYAASGPQGASRYLGAFLDRLTPGSFILELGCGGGRDAEAMIRRGFTVDATDGTTAIAREAEERLRQSVRVMRFDELDVADRYDAVWAHASLLHVPRTKLPAVLSLIYRALRPGGLHYASFKSEGMDGRDRFGRYFNQPSLADLIGFYQQSAPWEILQTDEFTGGGYGRTDGPWIAITVRKPSEASSNRP